MTKLLSIVIPISGDISNLNNLKETLRNGHKVKHEVEFILLFDEKNTTQSLRNWIEISSLPYENLELYRQTFSSVGAARNFGMTQATSSWISFTDADDVNYVERFVSMTRTADYEKTEVAIGDYHSVNLKSSNIIANKQEFLVPQKFQIAFGLNPGVWRCAFRLESLNETKFPDLNMAEDQIFIARFFDTARRIHFHHEIVYDYFVGSKSSLTNTCEQIGKISNAIPISMRLAIETKGPNQLMLETLAISQLLSSVKYGHGWMRFSSLFKFIRFFLKEFHHRGWQRVLIVIQIAKR